MARGRNILRRVLLVVLAAALGLAAYLASAAGLVRNQLPMPFGVGLAMVESNSMQPTFSRGDLLVVGQTDDIETGDVVVYQDPTIGLVVHRVVALDGELVTTQGDANNTADTPFDKSLVVGRVLAVVPAVGVLVAALRSPVGLVVLIAAVLLVVELPLRRQREQDEQHRDELRAQIAELKRPDIKHETIGANNDPGDGSPGTRATNTNDDQERGSENDDQANER